MSAKTKMASITFPKHDPKHVDPIPSHSVASVGENNSVNSDRGSHSTASYALDSTKAMSNKLAATNRPISMQPKMKSGNITLKLNTAVYELVKATFPKFIPSTGCTLDLKNTEQDVKGNCTRTVISVSSSGLAYTFCMYHTTSTVVINGQNPCEALQHLKSLAEWWCEKGYNQQSITHLSQSIAMQTQLWLSTHKPSIDDGSSGKPKCPKCKKNIVSKMLFCIQGQVWFHKHCAKMSNVPDGNSVPKCLVCQPCLSTCLPQDHHVSRDTTEAPATTKGQLVNYTSCSTSNQGGTSTNSPNLLNNSNGVPIGQIQRPSVTAISNMSNPSHVISTNFNFGQTPGTMHLSMPSQVSMVTSVTTATAGPVVTSQVAAESITMTDDEVFEDASSDILPSSHPQTERDGGGSNHPATSLYSFHSQLPPEGNSTLANPSEPQPHLEATAQPEFICPTCGLEAGDGTIECSTCGQWLHFSCAGVQDAKQFPEEVPYNCPTCQIKVMFPDNVTDRNQQTDKKNQGQGTGVHSKQPRLSNSSDSTVRFLQNQLKAQSRAMIDMENTMKDKMKEKEDIVNQLLDRIQSLETEVRSGTTAGNQSPHQSQPQGPQSHASSQCCHQATHPCPPHPPMPPMPYPPYPAHQPYPPYTYPPQPTYPPYPPYQPYHHPYYPPPQHYVAPPPTVPPIVVPIVVTVPQVTPVQSYPIVQPHNFGYKQPQYYKYKPANIKPNNLSTPTPPTPTPTSTNPPTPTNNQNPNSPIPPRPSSTNAASQTSSPTQNTAPPASNAPSMPGPANKEQAKPSANSSQSTTADNSHKASSSSDTTQTSFLGNVREKKSPDKPTGVSPMSN